MILHEVLTQAANLSEFHPIPYKLYAILFSVNQEANQLVALWIQENIIHVFFDFLKLPYVS
ncbi:hypothetical protein GCM10008915_25550 [Bifidobacterium pullorum subsp. gallinarum]|jgi:hypothetical protein